MLAGDVARWFIWLMAFAWGAAWGSFFNVAIYRWPRGMSVVTPPSHCPACGTPIRAWNNVPIVGWLFLRVKASCCGTSISPRYPLVELLAAVLCVAIAELWVVRAEPGTLLLHASIETLLYFVFAGGLLIATFVDLEWMEIPDEVSLPCAALGLVSAPFRTEPGLWSAAVGAGAAYLFVQVIFVWGYERIAGRRGMGEGDSKLLLMIGAFLGWQMVLPVLFIAALVGSLYGAYLMRSGGDGKTAVAFGSFLAPAACLMMFVGERILDIYLGLG